MGVYDQLLPTSGQYISTYAGLPIEETAALGETITQNFERGMAGVSAYNVMRNNVEVLDADKQMKDKLFDKSYEDLQQYAKAGDYENALPAIMNATSMIAGDSNLTAARAAKKSAGEFAVGLKKRFDKGDINREQYQYAIEQLDNYQGVANNDNIANHMYTPPKAVNIQAKLIEVGKDVEAEEKTYYLDDPHTGKRVKRTETEINPDELRYILSNALQSDPEIAAYYQDLVQRKGQEAADAIIAQDMTAAYAAVHDGVKIDDQYITRDSNMFKTGSENDNVSPDYNYLEITSISKEALNLTLPGKDVDLDLTDDLEGKIALGKRIDENKYNQRPSWLHWLADIEADVEKMMRGVPDAEEAEGYRKLEMATKDYFNVSDEDWSSYSPDQKEAAHEKYAIEIGNQKQQIAIKNLTVKSAREAGFVGSTANPDQPKILEGAAKDIIRNKGNRTFFDIESGKVVLLSDDDHLKQALAINSKGGIQVQGETDYKNPYAKANPLLADSYVIVAYNEDGSTEKKYLVSKSDKYYGKVNEFMYQRYEVPVSNKGYSSTVADITTTFSAPYYPAEFKMGDISIKGNRDRDKSITLTELTIGGDKQDLEYLAQGYGLTYEDGKIKGLTEEAISQLIIKWNYESQALKK